ncbi:hypothetical protein EP7_005304 [Isosphaeraceae bacterium EP7]
MKLTIDQADGRPIVIVDESGTTVGSLPTRPKVSEETADIKPVLSSPHVTLRALDLWSLFLAPADNEIDLVTGRRDSPPAPTFVRVSTTKGIEPQPIADLTQPIAIHDRYIHLVGLNAPESKPLRFDVFQSSTTTSFTRVAKGPKLTPLGSLRARGEWDTEFLFADTTRVLHMFAVSETLDSQSVSAPLTFTDGTPPFQPSVKPTITSISVVPATGNPIPLRSLTAQAGVNFATNGNKVVVSGTGFVAGANILVTAEGWRTVAGAGTGVGDAWTVDLPDLPERNLTLRAELASGTTRSTPSDPVTLSVSRKALVISEILPTDFGVATGAQTLTIRFAGNPLDKGVAETKSSYTITRANGGTEFETPVPVGEFEASYDQATNSVSLKFTKLLVDNYQIQFKFNDLKDIYGNTLSSIQGEPKGAFTKTFIRTTTNGGLAALESAVIPPGRQAPFVKYPEFTEPRTPTNGFNPSDKVDTKVSRLYFYRDAHRVAQIVNRHVESYNKVAVDTRRRLASETRREADRLTDERKLQEATAVRAAQEARAAEKALEQANQKLNNLQQQGAAANNVAPQLQVQLDRAKEDLTAAQAVPAADRDDADIDRLKAQVDDLTLRRDAANKTATQVPESLPAARDAVTAAQKDVQAKRDAEAVASQTLTSDGFQEDRAREQQFRLEVAAASEDPDTFAPGVPGSIDPVEQVSVAVIGEGVIQLRGPIKGINIVRRMINEIDSPAGQVRIAVHTVQINGEHGDRMEKVKSKIKDSIDHARFVTMQSGQLLRNAVVKVAARRAVESAALCPDGTTQEARDAKYVSAFFGEDFVRELQTIDSEFLHSGNKVLSLHSMDSTSLASALFLMALAKNETRQEILAEFHASMAGDLPAAELNYFEAGGDRGQKHKHAQHKKDAFVLLAANAKFQSLTGYFNHDIQGNETLSPIQREFIRLAQIFKSRLVTELELNQRIKERGLIEDRIGNRLEELASQKKKEDEATEAVRLLREELNRQRTVVFNAFNDLGNQIGRVRDVSDRSDKSVRKTSEILREILSRRESFLAASKSMTNADDNGKQLMVDALPKGWESLPEIQTQATRADLDRQIAKIGEYREMAINSLKSVENTKSPAAKELAESTGLLNHITLPIRGRKGVYFLFNKDGILAAATPDSREGDLVLAKTLFHSWINEASDLQQFFENFVLKDAHFDAIDKVAPTLSRLKNLTLEADLRFSDFRDLNQVLEAQKIALTPVRYNTQSFTGEFNKLISQLSKSDVSTRDLNRESQQLRNRINIDVKGELQGLANAVFDKIDRGFRSLLEADLRRQFAEQNLAASRRPLDSKKMLDMLIDEMEDKYIELLEGTRSHTAVIDGYIKSLATALDDDFNTQFYDPAFRQVRAASRLWDVQLGQIEKTSILTNNRMFAKVSPTATMEFDLPKREILITEAMNGAKALVDEYGALLNDPTFLSLTKLKSGQPTSSMAQGTLGGGASSVRSVLPELSRSDDEEVLRQAGPGRREFGSALEALIPDPAIYKFETGTGYEIRPVIQPDGQAVTFDFNYMYTTNVREPVRADEKHLGRVKRHFYHGPVQLSNYELREVTDYQVALKASRTSRGVPLLEDVPALGILFRPLPNAESSLQQNVILAQSTIFPTIFDLMGLRWAPAVADLDTLRLKNADFVVRGRARDLSNRVYDDSTSSVDNSMRVLPSERRPDLYRSQETIPDVHPNGYRGPGLNLKDSQLREGYDPTTLFPPTSRIPGDSRDAGGDVGLPVLPSAEEFSTHPLPEGMVIPEQPDVLHGASAPANPINAPINAGPTGIQHGIAAPPNAGPTGIQHGIAAPPNAGPTGIQHGIAAPPNARPTNDPIGTPAPSSVLPDPHPPTSFRAKPATISIAGARIGTPTQAGGRRAAPPSALGMKSTMLDSELARTMATLPPLPPSSPKPVATKAKAQAQTQRPSNATVAPASKPESGRFFSRLRPTAAGSK